MNEPFSSLEVQLIRSSLTNKTDEEIAELLERPVSQVIDKINEITNGSADKRRIDVSEFKKKQELEKRPKPKGRRPGVSKERKITDTLYRDKEKKVRRLNEFDEKQRRKELEARNVNRKFKTVHVDYSKMKSVKVNKNTYVWVPKEMDEAKAIKHYHNNRDQRPEWLRKAEERMNIYS